ncbi:hypothetical protein HI113_45370, partial [Corallococcus exiguus]|uniref:hypothetical protein n=1 Tax=Corallococcus exiguus TaxID=83462 RepID=UPI0014739233
HLSGVVISWVRRSRRGADAWEPLDVPLAEEREHYEIEILSGVTVLRRLSSVEPSVVYAASDELADFGAAQAQLTIRVAQMSAVVGRGFDRLATLTVR